MSGTFLKNKVKMTNMVSNNSNHLTRRIFSQMAGLLSDRVVVPVLVVVVLVVVVVRVAGPG